MAEGAVELRTVPRARVVIGRTEYIALPRLGVPHVEAKIDTGAFRSALHYHGISVRKHEGRRLLVVTFYMVASGPRWFSPPSSA